jgi:hypothetical protein
VVNPGVDRASINPEGETTARDESFVIVTPVADAVLLFVSFSHAFEHSRRIASVTIYATTLMGGLTTHSSERESSYFHARDLALIGGSLRLLIRD